MRFSEDFLRQVRDKNDIESTIAPYVRLRRSGRLLQGLCPFHGEKTPSFFVYTESQSYHCFGCGTGGDVITFIKNIQNLSFYDAVKLLADRAGLRMPDNNYDDGMDKLRRRVLSANREAARFYFECLKNEKGKEGLEYLYARGLSPATVGRFGLGFAPNEWTSLKTHLNAKGFRDDELLQADLVKKSQRGTYYDTFRNRVMFPIIDLNGDVIGFGGRVMDDSKPKYYNTKDTVVYKKGSKIFALNFAKNNSEKKLILCEGYMDVISMHQYGFVNTVAGLGTALTDSQANLLSRYAEEIYLCYDADGAGQTAANRAIGILSRVNVKIRVIHLAGGKDPDEILKKNGPDYMRRLLSDALNDTEFRLSEAKSGLDLSVNNDRLNYVNAAVKVLASLPNPVEREVYISAVASEAGVGKESLTQQVEHERRRNRRKDEKAQLDRIIRETTEKQRTAFYPDGVTPGRKKAEELLLSSLFRNPDFCRQIEDMVRSEDFASALNGRIFSEIMERSGTEYPADLHTFAQFFSDEEMGHVSALTNPGIVLANTPEECLSCIRKMKEDAGAEPADVGKLNDADYMEAFRNIK